MLVASDWDEGPGPWDPSHWGLHGPWGHGPYIYVCIYIYMYIHIDTYRGGGNSWGGGGTHMHRRE